MSKPRPYEPNNTYLLTRRVTERRYFLRPDQQVANVMLFALAWYAARHEILVHDFTWMSNHVHLVVTDQHGNLPDFTRDLFSSTARALNTHLGRRENFWASGKGGVMKLVGDHSVVEKIAYSITNPVNAGIVKSHHRWRLNEFNTKSPLLSTLSDITEKREFKIKRPDFYFSEKRGYPEEITLTLTPPPTIEEKQYHSSLTEMVEEREGQIRTKRKSHGLPFLGMKKARRAKRETTPSKSEPKPKINPFIACSNHELYINELIRLAAFREAHALSMKEWKKGNRDMPFPVGTYSMRKIYKVMTAPIEYIFRELGGT